MGSAGFWILEGMPVPLHVHAGEIILHTFPCMFPRFTTYSADFCWNIVIAFICSNSKGSYKYFQINPCQCQGLWCSPVSPAPADSG